ncbi:efflux RND transporter permease subunit [Polaribacter sejongensis]
MVFVAMKLFNVDANIVALSGIAIAIGTMVDVGVILAENMIRHLDEEKVKSENVLPTAQGTSDEESHQNNKLSINEIIYNATAEVSGAILTAVLTTIISFVPRIHDGGCRGKIV